MKGTVILGFSPSEYQTHARPGACKLTDAGESWHCLDSLLPVPVYDRDYRGNLTQVFLQSGPLDREHHDWTLVRSVLRRHAFRVCPWATLWLAPGWLGSAYCLGKAWSDEGIALIQSGIDPNSALSIGMHEIWHLLEMYLPADLLEELDADLAKGPRYGRQEGPWSGQRTEYLSKPRERRARAFERIAMLEIDGVSLPRFGSRSAGRSLEILLAAWDGHLAADAWKAREQQSKERNYV